MAADLFDRTEKVVNEVLAKNNWCSTSEKTRPQNAVGMLGTEVGALFLFVPFFMKM
jgi:hypothetical protein